MANSDQKKKYQELLKECSEALWGGTQKPVIPKGSFLYVRSENQWKILSTSLPQ